MNSLVELLDDEQLCEAIEFDLIALGLRLRWLAEDDRLTWRDLKVIVRHSDRHSAAFRQQYPDVEAWGILEQLSARTVEALEKLWWAKTTDAKHKRNQPEPIWRPGVEKPEDAKVLGSRDTAISTDEMDDWLGWSDPLPSNVIEPEV